MQKLSPSLNLTWVSVALVTEASSLTESKFSLASRNTFFARSRGVFCTRLKEHSLHSRSWGPFSDFDENMFRLTKTNAEGIGHYVAFIYTLFRHY